MTDKVKLGSIGVGWWAGVLANALEAGGQGELVSCFSRTKDKRDAFADQYGCRSAGSLEELLSFPAIEGVVIATSHTSHRELVEAAAAAGKHIFVEKPLTLKTADGAACVAAAAAAGVALQVGHQRRRSTANRRIRRMIEAGDLGDLEALEAHLSIPSAARFPAEAWRWNPEESPLGSMTSLGVHHLDSMMYLAGPVRSVYAQARPGRQNDVEEMTVFVLEFQSGALGTLVTSFYTPTLSRLAVFGTQGAAYSERDGTVLRVQTLDQKAAEEVELEPTDPLVEQLVEFASVVRGQASPEIDGAAGLAVVAILEAAVESSKTGRSVAVGGSA